MLLSLLSRYDRLMISNDQNYNYGVYCGEMIGHTVLVNGSHVVISFKSDRNVQRKGFLLVFIAVQMGKNAGGSSLHSRERKMVIKHHISE